MKRTSRTQCFPETPPAKKLDSDATGPRHASPNSAKLKSESVGVANGSYKEGLRKSKNVSNDGVEMVIQRCSSPQRPGGGGGEPFNPIELELEGFHPSSGNLQVVISDCEDDIADDVLCSDESFDATDKAAQIYFGNEEEEEEELDDELDDEDTLAFEKSSEAVDQAALEFYGGEQEEIDTCNCENRGWLPLEIMEVIFCQLPIRELLCYCRLVCRWWNRVISREKFLYWKKLYLRCKLCYSLPSHQAVPELDDEKLAGNERSILGVARILRKAFSRLDGGDTAEAMSALRQHPRYKCAQAVYSEEKMPKEECGLMETITLMVACSHSVHEVLSIVGVLTPASNSSSTRQEEDGVGSCTRACVYTYASPFSSFVEVSEVFYCLATLFFVLWMKKLLPQRFHYNVFYALDSLERSSAPFPKPCPEATSHPRQHRAVQLTSEQTSILNHSFTNTDSIKIVAFAGTGKTTTLLHLALLNPDKRYLYCVFNKSVKLHAASIFPRNVTCKTFHSLAWEVGVKYKSVDKLSDLNAHKVSDWIQAPSNDMTRIHGNAAKFFFAKYVLKTVENYIASSDDELTYEHSFFYPKDIEHLFCSVRQYREAITEEAKQLWKEMKDLKNKPVKISHDGYLKLFQLKRPQVCKRYDCLMIDEAQDITPAIISLIQNQTNCPMILVGDPHQQIYSFRGAKNAMNLIHSTHVFYLTKSFRFGPEISYISSCILEKLKEVFRQTIVGTLKYSSVLGTSEGQEAIIARTNSELFSEMVKFCRSGKQCRVGFAGGIDGYEFEMYLAIDELKKKGSTNRHSFIKKFNNYSGLKAYAQKVDDPPLNGKLDVCEKYSSHLAEYIKKIRSMKCSDLKNADIVFSTAHKSKGLEFDTVRVTSDYISTSGQYDQIANKPELLARLIATSDPDELNLLYVAATRAKRQLIMPKILVDILQLAGEEFLCPVVQSDVPEKQLWCSECACYLDSDRVMFESPDITTGSGHVIQRKQLCFKHCPLKFRT